MKAEGRETVGRLSPVQNSRLSPYEKVRLLGDRLQESRKGTDRRGVRHPGKAN